MIPHWDVVVLSNGRFPENRLVQDCLTRARMVVCCDGAVGKLLQFGIEPQVIVGDMDSISPEDRTRYAAHLVHISDQNSNDQTKAVNWCIDKGYTQILILGATGYREDHVIGNIFLLSDYVKRAQIKMVTNYGVFEPVVQTSRFESFKGQQVSIFALDSEMKLTTQNLKYPLKGQALKGMWEGTLNESQGDWFEVGFDFGTLIVFRAFK